MPQIHLSFEWLRVLSSDHLTKAKRKKFIALLAEITLSMNDDEKKPVTTEVDLPSMSALQAEQSVAEFRQALINASRDGNALETFRETHLYRLAILRQTERSRFTCDGVGIG